MIANTAFLAVLTVFLLVGWLAGELQFLAPYWAALLHLYGTVIVGAVVVVFVNVSALYYALARWLFLRDTGRKLTHIDRELIASEGSMKTCRRTSGPHEGDSCGMASIREMPTAASVTRPTRVMPRRLNRATCSPKG